MCEETILRFLDITAGGDHGRDYVEQLPTSEVTPAPGTPGFVKQSGE